MGGSPEAQPSSALNGGRCAAKYYCPEGSSLQSDCTPGMYCDSPGLSEPTGNCSAGYYCLAGSRTATPTDGIQGMFSTDIIISSMYFYNLINGLYCNGEMMKNLNISWFHFMQL